MLNIEKKSTGIQGKLEVWVGAKLGDEGSSVIFIVYLEQK